MWETRLLRKFMKKIFSKKLIFFFKLVLVKEAVKEVWSADDLHQYY